MSDGLWLVWFYTNGTFKGAYRLYNLRATKKAMVNVVLVLTFFF